MTALSGAQGQDHQPPTLIRTMHPYGFRSGEWAMLRCVVPDPERDRDCYLVEFGDKATDFWVADDPDGRYEFRQMAKIDGAAPGPAGIPGEAECG